MFELCQTNRRNLNKTTLAEHGLQIFMSPSEEPNKVSPSCCLWVRLSVSQHWAPTDPLGCVLANTASTLERWQTTQINRDFNISLVVPQWINCINMYFCSLCSPPPPLTASHQQITTLHWRIKAGACHSLHLCNYIFHNLIIFQIWCYSYITELSLCRLLSQTRTVSQPALTDRTKPNRSSVLESHEQHTS